MFNPLQIKHSGPLSLGFMPRTSFQSDAKLSHRSHRIWALAPVQSYAGQVSGAMEFGHQFHIVCSNVHRSRHGNNRKPSLIPKLFVRFHASRAHSPFETRLSRMLRKSGTVLDARSSLRKCVSSFGSNGVSISPYLSDRTYRSEAS